MQMTSDLHQKTKAELLNVIQFSQTEIEKHIEKNHHLETQLEQQAAKIALLNERIQFLLLARFGSRSEKFTHPHQDSLFDEAVVEASELPVIEAAEAEIQVASFTRKKTGGRKALPENLPREEILHTLPEAEQICPCGCRLTKIGADRSEQLDYIPAQIKVLVHVREKWACKACEETVRTAPLPKQPIPKSIASPGLLAHVLVCKYEDHLPLYRQEDMLQRIGVDIARSTLAHWMIRCGALLQPLVDLMREGIRDYDIAYADETSIQVLKEKGRPAESKSMMWYFAGGPPEKRAIVYEYHPTREGKVVRDFLKSFTGYLHCDGYSGYEASFQTNPIIHVACWAHARRKFAEIIKSSKTPPCFAVTVINLLKKVYHLEKQFKEQALRPEEIYARRQAEAKPILLDLKQRLKEQYPKAPPQSAMAKAMHYTLNRWDALMNYLTDGRLDIDNNASERGIKTFVIGRKNWLFCDQPEGAHAGAAIYSLIQTCKIHGVEPYAYFKHVLAAISTASTSTELVALLPFNYSQPSHADHNFILS